MSGIIVTRVGHVGLRVRDLDRSIAFAESVIGLRVSGREDDTAYLTCNARHHELVLIAADEPGCDHLGFEVADPGQLDALRRALDEQGVPVLDAPLETGLADAVRFAAPGGFVFEVFTGMTTDEPPHYPTCGVRPRKFEHITVKSSRKDELETFLQELLGLRLSDRAGDAVSWLRVSEEHHGVSVIGGDVDGLHHYAWQTDGWDAMRRAGDRLMATDRRFFWGPGHHGIGDNYFCYFLDDDGSVVEYSEAILRVEDERTYQARTWPDDPLTVNRWGNPPPPPGFWAANTPLCDPRISAAR